MLTCSCACKWPALIGCHLTSTLLYWTMTRAYVILYETHSIRNCATLLPCCSTATIVTCSRLPLECRVRSCTWLSRDPPTIRLNFYAVRKCSQHPLALALTLHLTILPKMTATMTRQ